MNIKKLKEIFIENYGPSDQELRVFYAPGRVNLIGDHTDYNGGYVFPCGVDRGTFLLLRQSEDTQLKLKSQNFDPAFTIDLSELPTKGNGNWYDYPLGVAKEFLEQNKKLKGLELLYYGDLPQGAGLSSSASVEVVTAFALNESFSLGLSLIDLIKMSQSAEKNYVGVSCGIMDQFAVAQARENHAIQLDCASLEYTQVPFKLTSHQLIITNSNQERQLTDSAYNQRTEECARALRFFQQHLRVDNLAAISLQDFDRLAPSIEDEILCKRARHVVSEHHRVKEAVFALNQHDLATFGSLMLASHQSLRDDYQVSTPALNYLVEQAMEIPGTLGSRLTGAGFGGCTVSLVEKEKADAFCQQLGQTYLDKFSHEASFYLSQVSDGVREL